MIAGKQTVDDALFVETAEGPALLGSRCTDCAAYTFPRQGGCPRCTGSSMREVPLSRTGTLWSWTVQGFRPKTPYTGTEAYEPYGVAYVELPGQLIVEARLVQTDPQQLEIGMPVELTLTPFRDDESGRPVHTFAFVGVAA
ncbi:Zn-ribbon domain-containing OB-fold protein [Pseudonocardia broussonetiae]|uniref:DNA-binding protein n=1 Tax=Pseudonocardia broussonetiae TaxID=2736640 RepID=A0A6M6JIW9_9PSEU|nr:OB-fold domain-containing protein [Pseudonocardia broussonetiae]QJY47115.1 DNA-binding protein [Pseudonocardia broussonetiae]